MADNSTILGGIKIYTDGACSGNPGPGGWAAVLIAGERTKEISGGFARTTNGRMELTAVINALAALKCPCGVHVYTDAAYVVNAINKGWLANWQANGWRKSNKATVHNVDLWQRLVALLQKHEVTFVWVKGHADNQYNNRCDKLAVEAAHRDKLPIDTGFEATVYNNAEGNV